MRNGWDLIIVGAGSAGAVMASRTAARGMRVLLLEAGPDHRSADLPEVWRSPNTLRALLDPKAGEHVLQRGLTARRTERQEFASYWQGRGTGGSSSINGQIAIRPPMRDFADWADAGCHGWSPDDVLPYFSRLEDDLDFGAAPYHGTGGPIPVYRTPRSDWGAVDAAMHAAAGEAGFGWAEDVNAPGASGISPYPINSRHGRRVSTNDAYLEPARARENLTVRGDAVVDRVLLSDGRAVGVRALCGGEVVQEYADHVVLCAGAFHSPAILLRSGIGPAGHLREKGIAVEQDLPVGRGVQDHALFILGLPLRETAATRTDDRYTNVCVRYDSGDPAGRENDMMFVACNQNLLALAEADTSRHTGAFVVWLNQPYSRGVLRLASADPNVQPVVDQRMLSDPRDRSRMRAGVRSLLRLARSDRTREIMRGPLDDCNAALLSAVDSDRALDELLLTSVADGQHITSGCRMGAPGDPDSVVDPRCRVHGIDSLHVVDASVFPDCPRANTNLATIMAAELVADRWI